MFHQLSEIGLTREMSQKDMILEPASLYYLPFGLCRTMGPVSLSIIQSCIWGLNTNNARLIDRRKCVLGARLALLNSISNRMADWLLERAWEAIYIRRTEKTGLLQWQLWRFLLPPKPRCQRDVSYPILYPKRDGRVPAQAKTQARVKVQGILTSGCLGAVDCLSKFP